MLHRWLDTWPGIGHIIAGMARLSYDLELRRYDGRGWRATFYPAGITVPADEVVCAGYWDGERVTVLDGGAEILAAWLGTDGVPASELARSGT